ncbi:hypothetical protein LHFGNBLO_005045 [Mesorhizobium sp. AR10]|nr:hypothetical protein [Mesorhizobium sp. AR10]UVK37933.1 hypothetical protein LHFGNBLO_005045 [Mesorhizobium sp. AR10]
MRESIGTATVIVSIAVAIALLFMAPKGFQLSAPDPIVNSDASEVSLP